MLRTTRFSNVRRISALLAFGLTVAVLTWGLAPNLAAAAGPLDEPRASGIVGERFDGYAVVRDAAAATGAHHATVKDINAKRRAHYASVAAGSDVAAVARIYAKKIFDSAPAGYWFLLESGSWIQK